MPIDPAILERLPFLTTVPPGAPIEVVLERLAAFNGDGRGWNVPAEIDVQDLVIPGPEVRLRRYTPERSSGTRVLWMHGGGFSAGTLDWPESHVVSAELAARSGATVFAVDYRLAGPESRYPASLDDVIAAAEWVARDDAPLLLGGASAGAALALAAALRLPRRVDGLLLAYPFVHFPVPPLAAEVLAEMLQLPAMLRFPPESIESMVAGYVGRIHSLPPDALPGHAAVGADQPRTWILLSEYDDLRPSGELLAKQHAEAGVAVSVRLEQGVLHGHLNRHPGDPGVDASLDWFADAIRAATPGSR